MGRIIVETARLVLREIEPADADAMFALNSDPEVVRYTGDAFASLDDARAFFGRYAEIYARDGGLGRWAIVVGGDVVGFCGLRRLESGDVDLGYRIVRRLWGRGLVTEAAQAALDVGFHRFDLARIEARAHEDNAGSIRVMEKLGMTRVGPVDVDGDPGVLYLLERPTVRR